MPEQKLFSYKITHDSGFAPNPFGGLLTLATCKPKIREHKKIGDWIAGFTSIKLNGDNIGEERLIYLMKVTDKISFSEYWKNQKYENRKPQPDNINNIRKRGDNIYEPKVETPITYSDYKQLKNPNHTEKDKIKDLSGKFALISSNFYYFGSTPVTIPTDIRPKVPFGQSSHGVQTHDDEKILKFLSFIESNYIKGLHNHPHSWFKDDVTWKEDESYIKP